MIKKFFIMIIFICRRHNSGKYHKKLKLLLFNYFELLLIIDNIRI